MIRLTARIPRIQRHRKAISPILATLLLVVIAVAAIVVTYAWIMTYMNNAGKQAGVTLYNSNVRFYVVNDTKKIDIDVGNSGSENAQVIRLYVGQTKTSETTQTITPVTVVPGAEPQTLTIDYDWTTGTRYWFKVISDPFQSLEWSDQAL